MLKDVPMRFLECVENDIEGLREVFLWGAVTLQNTRSQFHLSLSRALNALRANYQILEERVEEDFEVSKGVLTVCWFVVEEALKITAIATIEMSPKSLSWLRRASLRLAVNSLQ